MSEPCTARILNEFFALQINILFVDFYCLILASGIAIGTDSRHSHQISNRTLILLHSRQTLCFLEQEGAIVGIIGYDFILGVIDQCYEVRIVGLDILEGLDIAFGLCFAYAPCMNSGSGVYLLLYHITDNKGNIHPLHNHACGIHLARSNVHTRCHDKAIGLCTHQSAIR